MTTERFRALCEEVLLPLLLSELGEELREHKDLLATILRDVLRVRDELEALQFALATDEDSPQR